MKLKMYFLMLALGVCGAAMQSCDDDDDNLKVPEKLLVHRACFSGNQYNKYNN